MSDPAPHILQYWRRHTDGQGAWKRPDDGPPGEDLAALRRGIGRQPGDVPEMWRFYTRLSEDGEPTADLYAEHAALTLFAVHQQSKARPMHRGGVGVGRAVFELRRSTAFSPETVDRRFAAAATATSLPEVVTHLRGLVTQLRGIDQVLDYTRLYLDLRGWQDPEQRSRVRRHWGSQYFIRVGRAAEEPGQAGQAGTDPAVAVSA
ncbi:MAG TPA: type I-E CRISPR-associated protein Cse2/CasB [Mycobacteriales bacterium]|nr:type I-E CRISPR-associated protein Cse2/CasB [Mycobacteriales bacterium]